MRMVKQFKVSYIQHVKLDLASLFANVLAALAGVESWLITMRPTPTWLAMAHRSLQPIRLADAMDTVELLAGLTARHHARLHLSLGEVLELVVDVQVLDAAVKAGTILDLPETESSRVDIYRHAWRRRWINQSLYVGRGVV